MGAGRQERTSRQTAPCKLFLSSDYLVCVSRVRNFSFLYYPAPPTHTHTQQKKIPREGLGVTQGAGDSMRRCSRLVFPE